MIFSHWTYNFHDDKYRVVLSVKKDKIPKFGIKEQEDKMPVRSSIHTKHRSMALHNSTNTCFLT